MAVRDLVEIGFVPGLLVLVMIVAAMLPGQLAQVADRRAAQAGFWIGPVATLLFALSFAPVMDDLGGYLPSLVWWIGVAGFAVGFAFPHAYRWAEGDGTSVQRQQLPASTARHTMTMLTVRSSSHSGVQPSVHAQAATITDSQWFAWSSVLPDDAAEHPPWFRRAAGPRALTSASPRRSSSGSWVAALTAFLSTASVGGGYVYLIWPDARLTVAVGLLAGLLGVLVRVVSRPSLSLTTHRPVLRRL